MLKNILVPLDGSPLAEAALPYAKALAGRTGARLTLVRAAHYPGLLGDAATAQYRAIERAEEYLSRLVEQLTREGYQVQAGVPFGGHTAEWILEETQVRHADLVIMATHGRTGFDRLVHGSVAETVVHRSTVPVMLVREADAEQLAQRIQAQPAVFVVPLDGSGLAETALASARDLAQAIAARVVLVGVVPADDQLFAGQGGAILAYSERQLEQMQASARTYLEGIARDGDQVDVRSGDPATQIAEAAGEHSAAAVVMATHGRTGVVRSLLGSVAGGVVHHTDLPVLLVRAHAANIAEEPAVQLAAPTPAS